MYRISYTKYLFQAILTGLGMTFEGRQHSGIDDSQNITRILKELAQLGHVFVNTTSIRT